MVNLTRVKGFFDDPLPARESTTSTNPAFLYKLIAALLKDWTDKYDRRRHKAQTNHTGKCPSKGSRGGGTDWQALTHLGGQSHRVQARLLSKV
jgi:hypothetical protein